MCSYLLYAAFQQYIGFEIDTVSHNRAKSRTFPGADINSDHDLVMMTMKLKLKQTLRSHGSKLKFTLERLKVPKVADLFKATIGADLQHSTCWKKT